LKWFPVGQILAGFIKMINNNLHFVWLGSQIPDKEKRNIASWHKFNPELEIKIWEESNIHDLDINENCMKAIEVGAGIYAYQADIIRYIAVNKFGGFYSDTDIECHKTLDFITPEQELIVLKPHDRSNWLTNAFFASTANHPFLLDLIDNIAIYPRGVVNKKRSYLFGPTYFTNRLVKLSGSDRQSNILNLHYDKCTVLDNDFWSVKNKDRYCTHFFNASWIIKEK